MDPETRRQVEALQAMYPKPRVGQRVKLRSGKVLEIITVRKARDVLKGMQEIDAVVMGPRMQALYGRHWLDVYYEAEAMRPGIPAIVKVTPVDVEEIVRE